jgi:hypothetical protein
MAYITPINDLEEKHWTSMTYNGIISDDGVKMDIMESGEVSVLKRWVTYGYNLVLSYLEYDKAIEIINAIENSMLNDSTITLDFDKCKTAGWFNFNVNNVDDPSFIVELRSISVSRVTGLQLFNLSINLKERIYVD